MSASPLDRALAPVLRLLGGVAALIAHVVLGLKDFLGTVLGGLLGHWQAPQWLAAVVGALCQAGQRLHQAIRARPTASLLTALIVSLIVGAGYGGWRWWQAQPKPHVVAVTIEAPAPACWDCVKPWDGPNPVRLSFAEDVAPIQAVLGQTFAAPSGLSFQPKIAGQWKWESATVLSFTPSAHWPVGQGYALSLPRNLLRPNTPLEHWTLEFASAPLTVEVGDVAFHQDPTDPGLKIGVATYVFSHPIDPASIESHLTASLRTQEVEDNWEDTPAPHFTVTYDQAFLKAFMRSERLTMPAFGGELLLKLKAGARPRLPGNGLASTVESRIAIPGRYALKLEEAAARIARDADDSPSQLLQLTFSHSMSEDALKPRLRLWMLPERHPNPKVQKAFEQKFDPYQGQPFDWSNENVPAEVLRKLSPLAVALNATESPHSAVQSLRHSAAPGRYLHVAVDGGLTSFGGYQLRKGVQATVKVPAFPRELRLQHRGSLLALSGSKKVALMARDIPGMRVKVQRLLPRQLQHLITQTNPWGELQSPEFINQYNLAADNLTEDVAGEQGQLVALGSAAPGTPQFESFDLSPYLAQAAKGDPRGVFLLRVQAWDVAKDKAIEREEGEAVEGFDSSLEETRLVVITDLGLVQKTNADGSRTVFVQSIASGNPVEGVSLSVMGKNGEAVLTRRTDAQGRAELPKLSEFKGPQEATLLLASLGDDQSFLPLDYRLSALDTSRWDVGGVTTSTEAGALSAFLFTDRGLYRPSERAELAAIVKPVDFKRALPGTQVELEVLDSRGNRVLLERQRLTPEGLITLHYQSAESSPTGTYRFSAYLPNGKSGRSLLGSADFTVRDFAPDRLKMRLGFNQPSRSGWLRPQDLAASVDLQNLFGTPAQNRKVQTEMRLGPWVPSFAGYAGYHFSDPNLAKESFSDTLPEATTDADGKATLALNLQRFAAATYRVHLTAQGFEPDGGRSVTAEVAQVVSTLPYLVGWQAEGSLEFVPKGQRQGIRLVALGPDATPVQAKGLRWVQLARNTVSMLVKRDNGTFAYESRVKEIPLDSRPFDLTQAGQWQALDTQKPGSFSSLLQNAAGQTLARVDYRVVGNGEVSASLEKNTELSITLNKSDYQPGEEVAIAITAPYTGAGLITIEREKVLAAQWFKASTTASVQRIKLPEGLEGSAYVQVMFTRDLASDQTLTSPLSYGIAPLSVALDGRRSTLSLKAPPRIKPGETLQLTVTATRPGKAVVYAVDEGILQVARYSTPKPLEFFFQKRMLEVETRQILDLILPEFKSMGMAAAPGGDGDGSVGRHLNPFKRKGQKPVAFWSGPIDVGPAGTTIKWTVPESFNGKLRLMAVQAGTEAIGRTEAETLVRGDFVLLPNTPLAVAPGDEFEASAGVVNNLENGARGLPIQVRLATTAGLEVLEGAAQTVKLDAGQEGLVRFKLRARAALGNAELRLQASAAGKSAQLTQTVSVRPAVARQSRITVQSVGAGKDARISPQLTLYPQQAERSLSASALPLTLAGSITSYLQDYPYYCTEQLVSMGLPALIAQQRPELVRVLGSKHPPAQALLNELAVRQTADGGFRLWPEGQADDAASLHASHYLLEAQQRGQAVDDALLANSQGYLLGLARQTPQNLGQAESSAYAIWLLSRQGQVLSAEADALREALAKHWAKRWEGSPTAAWLAASYGLMQRREDAAKLIARVQLDGQAGSNHFASALSADAQRMAVLTQTAPQRSASEGARFMAKLSDTLSRDGVLSTYDAWHVLLALDAMASQAAPQAVRATSVDALQKRLNLALGDALWQRASVPLDSRSIEIRNPGPLPVYASLWESGYPLTPPPASSGGIEVAQLLTDADGKPLSTLRQGQEAELRLRIRPSKASALLQDVVVASLLPAGFEIVAQQPASTPEMVTATPEEGDGSEPEEDGDALANPMDGMGRFGGWVRQGAEALLHAELREDRAVFFLAPIQQETSLRITVKATSAGRFTLPGASAEAMYRPSVRGNSAASTVVVTR